MSANPGAAESLDSNALRLGKQRNPEVHIRSIPRLISPGVQLEFVKPKQVKNKYPWGVPNSSMPVLEKMSWKQSMNKHLSDVNCTIQKKKEPEKRVWEWIRQGPGVRPVGRWVSEEGNERSHIIHNDNLHKLEEEADKWAEEARERRRFAMMERRRTRIMSNTPLLVDRSISQELMEQSEPLTEEYEDHNVPILEDEVVDVEGGVNDPMSSSFSTDQQWSIYDDVPIPSSQSKPYNDKNPLFDPIAVAAMNRTKKAASRLIKTNKQKEEEQRKQDLKKEKEERLQNEKKEMEEEKEKKKAVDEVAQLRREKRAEYVKRLRAIKRLEMGEIEWKKYLEMENMKRQEREKKKMEIPGYIEKKRLRQTLKTREVRARQGAIDRRRLYGHQREEEVYEDGVYEMDETQVNQLKDGGLNIQEDEEIEVE